MRLESPPAGPWTDLGVAILGGRGRFEALRTLDVARPRDDDGAMAARRLAVCRVCDSMTGWQGGGRKDMCASAVSWLART